MPGCGGVAWGRRGWRPGEEWDGDEGDGDEGEDEGWRQRPLLLEIKTISVLI
jgi:hypothetical protein